MRRLICGVRWRCRATWAAGMRRPACMEALQQERPAAVAPANKFGGNDGSCEDGGRARKASACAVAAWVAGAGAAGGGVRLCWELGGSACMTTAAAMVAVTYVLDEMGHVWQGKEMADRTC